MQREDGFVSRLTEFAVGHRSVVILLAAGLAMAGITAWGQLQQELLPDINLPIVTVVASYPGAGAEDVADQVTAPIERAVSAAPRLTRVQSTSTNSLTLIVAQFSFGTNVKETRAAIEASLRDAGLPVGVQPQVTAFNFNQQPVVIASIRPVPGASIADVARIANEEILAEIRAVEGVTAADLTGGETQQVVISLDPTKLSGAGVSLQQVTGILQANNVTLPAGNLPSGATRLPVSATHRLSSLDEIRALVVGTRKSKAGAGGGGGPAAGASPAASSKPGNVTIGDLGTVDIVSVQASGYARTNGAPSLTLSISKAGDANTVKVADEVSVRLAQAVARHPGVLAIDTIVDQSTFIKESRDGLVREGGLGAVFAILTILLFLLSLRSTLVAAVSIPLSILAALAVMAAAGMTVNILTLGGLAVAVGRVVDDAIVVLENIYRHRARGDAIGSAVVSGTREVATAITSSTLTTVCVFLPLGFVGGIVSQFFLPFALTVTFALLASLLVALTVVPVLAYFLLGRVRIQLNAQGELPETIWQRVYTPILAAALRSKVTRWATLAIAAGLFVASTTLVGGIPTQFINAGSEKILGVTVSPPLGASSDAVRVRTEQVEQILMADPDVTLVQATIPGDAGSGFGTLQSAFTGRAANSATLTVRLRPEVNLEQKTAQARAALAAAAGDGYGVEVGQQTFGTGGARLSIIVSGPDQAKIHAANDVIVAALATSPDLANVKSDLVEATPQVRVDVDPNLAIDHGLTTAQVAGDVRMALIGQQLGRIKLGDGAALPLVLSLRGDPIDSIDALRSLPVGIVARVPLGDIATVERVDTQGSVTRVDSALAATVSADIVNRDQGAVSLRVRAALKELKAGGQIPDGVSATLSGVSEQQSEAFGSLFFSMGVAVLLVYVVMVLVFNSLIDPFVILFSLPLATIGAFPALFITGRPIGISALIGFLMLIGIVVTNAIVLLDLVEQLRHRGYSTQDALMAGGRTRVRPILMTAVATILALMPVTLGFNSGSIIAAELGTVVIGGLFSSTVLTLVIVPVVYSLVDDLKKRAGAA